MPVVNSVKQVLRMQDGEPVAAFKGKVKEVFKRRSGTSSGGRDWTVQNVICIEADAKLELVLWNAEMIRADREGSIIYIESEDDAGVIADDYEWKNKTKRQLKCSKFTISWGEGPSPESNGDGEEETRQSPAADPRKPATAPRADFRQAKFYTARCANGMILAMRAAIHVAKTVEKESKLIFAPEWIQRAVFEIYGSLERSGLLEAMPVKPLEQLKPAYEPGADAEESPSRIAGKEEAHDAQQFPEEDLPTSKKPEPVKVPAGNDNDVPF